MVRIFVTKCIRDIQADLMVRGRENVLCVCKYDVYYECCVSMVVHSLAYVLSL